ncbi:LapA family protein [Pusillimonas sp. CC-YST705]|uniref:LapA family protein n=1 Tax=Mesopusillimonas faecipullorum TaxID=2755040 RepID=A0ABS8CD83_9BURK|nr:LapA family protein [Mesopusillimonas faecipullorum]MCB5363997.1 LapA family protein [Mesopusillimonas faecipullorum]
MRYVIWALRLLVFVLVLLFALNNTGPVDVTFYADYVLHQVPLIVVMLVTFIVGALFALLLILPSALRRRREASRLRRELEKMRQQANKVLGDAPKAQTPAPEVVAPLAPM